VLGWLWARVTSTKNAVDEAQKCAPLGMIVGRGSGRGSM
jgi:hypothetical protein